MKETDKIKSEVLNLMQLDGKREHINKNNKLYRKVIINPTSEDDLQKFCKNYFRIYQFSLYNFIRRLISLDAVIVYTLFMTVYIFSEISQGITKKYLFVDTAISLFLNIGILVVIESLFELKLLKDIKNANSQHYLRIVPKMSYFEKVMTKDIKVGNIIRVFQGEEFPADVVILYSKKNTNAVVDSFKIDGLYNKSIKYPVEKYKIDRDYLKMLSEINGVIKCELPNKNVFCFQGTYKLDKHPRSLHLSYENFALQSSILKGAEYIDGVVVYTGADTKKNLNIPRKIEENMTFCIKMNNVVYYLIFMYILFVLLSIIIKAIFYRKGKLLENSNDTFFTVLEDFIGLYILVLPVMLYSEKSLIYIIQSLKIERDTRMNKDENSNNTKVFNKNKNDALGTVDIIATARNGVLVNKKEILVSCTINNVLYSKKKFIISDEFLKLPSLNILDAERTNVSELLNLDERIFKDPENIFFPSRDFNNFLKILGNNTNPIYDPINGDFSKILKEIYRNYLNEEFLYKKIKLSSSVKSLLDNGYNQFLEDCESSYDCKEIIEDGLKNNEQSEKIEEFILGICACNRIIIYNEKFGDIEMKDNINEKSTSEHMNYDKDREVENIESENKYAVDSDGEENMNTIEHEDICLFNTSKNIGFHIYCYKKCLFFYNLKNICKEYYIICFHDFLRSNNYTMCILKNKKELDKGILYIRGYDFNILPYLCKNKNDINKIKKTIKIHTANYLKVILICKKNITNEDIAKYIYLKSVRSKFSFKFFDIIKTFFLYDLECIGIIGLKNDLNDGVVETFNDINNFDIRSWIFTNDSSKNTYLTALQCNLITPNSNLFIINFLNPDHSDEETVANYLFNNFLFSMENMKSRSYAIAINEMSLKNIMRSRYALKVFLCIIMRATVVLFCKLNNETKGKIISKFLSYTTPKLTVLGVGSTLNDAYLLKNTTISVCLTLNKQVNALYSISDYAMEEFKYVGELLILGRLNRFSLCRAFLWIIYLKVMIGSFYFFHNFDNFFSGSSISSILYSQTAFAIFHYSLIVAFASYEIDIPYKFIRNFPYIYQLARRKYFLNNTIIFLNIVESIFSSFISYYILRGNLFNLITHRKFTFHIFVLNFFLISEKILLFSKTWHIFFFIMTIIIVSILFIYINIYTLVDCLITGKCEFSLFDPEDSYFWISLLPILYINFIIDKFMKFVKNKIYPDITYHLSNTLKIETQEKFATNNKREEVITDKNIEKLAPVPKSYIIKEDNAYYGKSKKNKYIFDTLRKIIDIKIKYRNQQLNLEYKTYEKRNKLKLRIIILLLFIIFLITFTIQIIISKFIEKKLHSLSYLTVIYYIVAVLYLIKILIRNKTNYTYFYIIGKLLLVIGYLLEISENSVNNIINMLVTYSFTVCYIFFISFKILEGLVMCIIILSIAIWVYYHKNNNLNAMCTDFCDNPYTSLDNLEYINISCICKQQIFTFLICTLSFTLICLFMKYYEIYYLKKKFLTRYKQKVNLGKQIEILHTMLPSFLVEYLLVSDPKADGIMVGKNISGEDRGIISVIFCDIDDFQTMVSTLEPHTLVQTLDNLYLYFDKCIKYFNCIKIETVFESYLAASGLSEKKNNCVHKIKYDTKCAIKMAIAQLSAKYYISYKVLDTLSNNKDSNSIFPIESKYIYKNISLRIGIHTGKAISGVIGSVKPQYSLFGDTVNTASRMKSTSLKDHIHVSYDTYKYLKDDKTLVWKERSIFIKGKGEMKTYLLVDILDNSKKDHTKALEESTSSIFRSNDEIVNKSELITKEKEFDKIEMPDKSEIIDETKKIFKKSEKPSTKKKKIKKENAKEKNINIKMKEMGEILNNYDKEKVYNCNKSDDGSNSIGQNDFLYSTKNYNYKKSKYLDLERLSTNKSFRRNVLAYNFESPINLPPKIGDNTKRNYDSDNFFTSPYIIDKNEKDEIRDTTNKALYIKKSKNIINRMREDSIDFKDEFSKENDKIKEYIKERITYRQKVTPNYFNFNNMSKYSNAFKKKKKKKKDIQKKYTYRQKTSFYNFLNKNDIINYNYSSEFEYFIDPKMKNKKPINFNNLFAKIYKKKLSLLNIKNEPINIKKKNIKNKSRDRIIFSSRRDEEHDDNQKMNKKLFSRTYAQKAEQTSHENIFTEMINDNFLKKEDKEQCEIRNENRCPTVFLIKRNKTTININKNRVLKRIFKDIITRKKIKRNRILKNKKLNYVNKNDNLGKKYEILNNICLVHKRAMTFVQYNTEDEEKKRTKRFHKNDEIFGSDMNISRNLNGSNSNIQNINRRSKNKAEDDLFIRNKVNLNNIKNNINLRKNIYKTDERGMQYNDLKGYDKKKNTEENNEDKEKKIEYDSNENIKNGFPKNEDKMIMKKRMISKRISFYSLKEYEKGDSFKSYDNSSCGIKSKKTNSIISDEEMNEYFNYNTEFNSNRNKNKQNKEFSLASKVNNIFKNIFKKNYISDKLKSGKYNTMSNSKSGQTNITTDNKKSQIKKNGDVNKANTNVSNKNSDFVTNFDNYNKNILKKLTSTLQINRKTSYFNRFYYKFKDEELEEEYTREYYQEIINIDLTKKLIIIFVISELILSLCNVIELSYYENKETPNDFIVIIWLIRSIYLFTITFIWLLLKTKLKEYKDNSSKMMWTTFILNIFLSSWGIIMIDLACIHYSNLVGNSRERSIFFMKDATELIISMQLIFVKNMLFKHKFFFFVFFFVFLMYSFFKLFVIHVCELRICCSILLILSINILYFWYSEYLDRTQYIIKRKRNRMERTSHDFLTRILPRQVLEEYQNDNLQLTYKHEKIAFLFADIVGFTKWSKTAAPKNVLKLLQKLISKIDKDTIKLGLYKLFTIGDAYVATSQPNASITDQTEAADGIISIFKLAKLILHNINTIKIQFNKHDFNMRIGLHYGSCVGGIIGSVRIRYDMWGLDVLIANHIESNGIPGEIVCSEQFKNFFLENEPHAKLNFWHYKTISINDKDIKIYVVEDKNYEEDYDPKIINYETLLKLREQNKVKG
ncbi:guanylyl cyclase beta [Plasmodium berghei]|uniref:Guanylate cyclase beta n=2 Tax=Plasmodium berghei TaxID=5821 RepID=GCYB_PLABA|nr:guanylyl cyclase beta [Plasmodium berghei ANKA]A0A509APX1.1 RecName: Full=Guanylate cyclase beta; Short=PfGCbeta; AltName: Full=Guanylyl cyclase beta [Plasmodium berghei ANKA]SCM24164.1 guanylyl cyclase beta [Plasmodium berghei]SCN26958.1 guanylyl cyclase beta [Plasmodium berghei]SCO63379.1 guanylyl cyclase beta [Plasmodium berghei]VUC56788.1 guanylyl cyclase beta [Plasmodium berghei ANKA]|eukprot:XP_034422574.1 guanylyl cyclase beta [Plasmodium berghei ANKA]